VILVVDDEVDVCELMADYLQGEGYKVKTAFSVPKALKLIKENQFEAVVCDLVIQSGKGESVLNYLRKKGSGHEKIPCLLVSGKKGPDEVDMGEHEAFLSKPFCEEEFMTAFSKLKSSPKKLDRKEAQDKGSKVHPDLIKILGS